MSDYYYAIKVTNSLYWILIQIHQKQQLKNVNLLHEIDLLIFVNNLSRYQQTHTELEILQKIANQPRYATKMAAEHNNYANSTN